MKKKKSVKARRDKVLGHKSANKHKTHIGSFKNKEYSLKNSTLLFGYYGLKCYSKNLLETPQIMLLKAKLLKMFKGIAQVWLRYTPQKPLFFKAGGLRMGKGKGEFLTWVAPIKAGDVLFEISRFTLTKQLNKKLKSLLSGLAANFKLIKLNK